MMLTDTVTPQDIIKSLWHLTNPTGRKALTQIGIVAKREAQAMDIIEANDHKMKTQAAQKLEQKRQLEAQLSMDRKTIKKQKIALDLVSRGDECSQSRPCCTQTTKKKPPAPYFYTL